MSMKIKAMVIKPLPDLTIVTPTITNEVTKHGTKQNK